jgi:hypothetical protein
MLRIRLGEIATENLISLFSNYLKMTFNYKSIYLKLAECFANYFNGNNIIIYYGDKF